MSVCVKEEQSMSTEEIASHQLPAYAGKKVRLKGHVQAVRDMGNLLFLVLRDRHGTAQVVVSDAHSSELARSASLESTVEIEGTVEKKPNGGGGFELQLSGLKVLSTSKGALPVEISKPSKMDSLALTTMLDYRPLTLRSPKVRAVFKIEAVMAAAFREFLTGEEFTEIHSPKIVSTGTEGGAQLFRLDYFGRQAFLAQSPQFYKQMMVGVFERVFEVGPVYRAEEHDTTRHLNEYVSMDVEMGFIESERDLMRLLTRLLAHVFARVEEKCEQELSMYGATVPKSVEIPSITLSEAIDLINSLKAEKAHGEKTDLDPDGERILCEHFLKKEGTDLVFVTSYPKSVRPFYAMPDPAPDGQSTLSFDLLFRGLEIVTGGQRIHDHDMLVGSIAGRGLDPESFKDYLQCFRYGMPPHGGFAIGLERLAKQLLGLKSVKLAALFPRDINRLTP